MSNVQSNINHLRMELRDAYTKAHNTDHLFTYNRNVAVLLNEIIHQLDKIELHYQIEVSNR